MRFYLFSLLILWTACASAAVATAEDAIRIKDLGKMSGWRDNALSGYGLVTGLAGTGDSSRNKTTRQSIANMLSRYDLTIVSDDVQSRNVAAVMVTATLPPFARIGSTLDVSITSIGDARSLVGGTLIMAPLKAANGKVYALAQGALSVGGYKYDLNGNVVQKNHPTAAAIPGGATVETSTVTEIASTASTVTFLLADPDYTTASRVAKAINESFNEHLAVAVDAAGIDVVVPPSQRAHLADFLMALENVNVEPDRRAKVVINERTGTIVSGGDVRIAKVAVSQGDLKVSIQTDNNFVAPLQGGRRYGGNAGALVSNSEIAVREDSESGFVAPRGNTVSDLVETLTKLKTNTRDIISILRACKAAGALHAELIVQ